MDLFVARPVCPIGGGTQVEAQTGVSNTMVMWTLVGVDLVGSEIAAHGELAVSYSRTNSDGKAFNYYFAPSTAPTLGYKDRVKVSFYV